MTERLISPEAVSEDALNHSLRPERLADFTGQEEVRQNLKIFIEAAKSRKEALDHVLLYGPPGLGKTTLAQIIAKEMGVNFRSTSGPIIARAGDLAAILTNLQPHDVLFIDEIHRLNPAVEEVLYPAMEDFKLDLMIGEGPSARSIQIDLPPFTLIGATTRSGLLTQPLRERFGIPLRLQFYTLEELKKIITRNATLLGCGIMEKASGEIAARSRGTPRIAGRLVRRVRDFAAVSGDKEIKLDLTRTALDRLGVDPLGLDAQDRRYLHYLANYYKGGPAGVETLAAVLSEQKDTLEEVIEPYLIQCGLIQRTPRGRVLTDSGYEHIDQRVESGG
jgi:holliday junction DNA helicase RuvB